MLKTIFTLYENFYSHTPCGVQLQDVCEELYRQGFLLTHPSRGATILDSGVGRLNINFYSHTPHGVQRNRLRELDAISSFLLTHPSRGATIVLENNFNHFSISTHTPLTGCNEKIFIKFSKTGNFYSHTPHGVQLYVTGWKSKRLGFLLTHPSRGATSRKRFLPSCNEFLLTHPSRGATHLKILFFIFLFISTHTPLTGCNPIFHQMNGWYVISTHTPLTGCNSVIFKSAAWMWHFYSHTPHGVQLLRSWTFWKPHQFLLTHPSRGATWLADRTPNIF